MKKQCVIVGLGKYGTSVAKKLSDSGIEVSAIDLNMKTVEKNEKKRGKKVSDII